ncbi:GDP-L-fucose synthase [Gammaproteobacteria bacterium]|nr:GDP-L-fucose synthase [Gammaproteobacteria bacterium]
MKKVFVAGHNGMVGASIVRSLETLEEIDLITAKRKDLDLLSQKAVDEFFSDHQIDQVYLAAARVGGIFANSEYPADFIYQNLTIQSNVIHSAYTHGVERLLFLGSSCIYPKLSHQPIEEDELLKGTLEPTNEAYAIAKIAGLKMCEAYFNQFGADFRSVMPTNLYGIGDNFHPENSHVIPGLIYKIDRAKKQNKKKVVIWGSGKAMREFLYVDDLADACVHLMNLDEKAYNASTTKMNRHINVGTGTDISILELAEKICKSVGYSGEIESDLSMPDGTPKKLLDVKKIHKLGWRPKVDLDEGLERTYEWYINHHHFLKT